MKIIRQATAQDIEFLALSSIDEGKKSVPFDTTIEKLRANLEFYCFNHDARLTVVSENENLCGYLAATISKIPQWNDDLLLSVEMLFYVLPKYRLTRVAHMLMNDFINWSKEMNCSLAIVSSRAALNGDAVGKFYSRFGFQPMDTNYTLRLRS
jgi:GNAT superfamily N-acetyltransferase